MTSEKNTRPDEWYNIGVKEVKFFEELANRLGYKTKKEEKFPGKYILTIVEVQDIQQLYVYDLLKSMQLHLSCQKINDESWEITLIHDHSQDF